jgi:hypothetical protein
MIRHEWKAVLVASMAYASLGCRDALAESCSLVRQGVQGWCENATKLASREDQAAFFGRPMCEVSGFMAKRACEKEWAGSTDNAPDVFQGCIGPSNMASEAMHKYCRAALKMDQTKTAKTKSRLQAECDRIAKKEYLHMKHF